GHETEEDETHEARDLGAKALDERDGEYRDAREDQKEGRPMRRLRSALAHDGLEREDAGRKDEEYRERPHDEVPPRERPGEDGFVNVDEAPDDPVVFLASKPPL